VFSICARWAAGNKADVLVLSVAGLFNISDTTNIYFRKGGKGGKDSKL
jgi:hypothetical protein